MEKKIGKNLKFLRQNNTKEVLKYLALKGDTSRIKLAKELGLSKMTITNIVNDLQSEGYVYESDLCDQENVGNTGPKPVMLRVKQNRLMAVGIYLARYKMVCALSDIASGEIFVDQREFSINGTREDYITQIIAMIEKVLSYSLELSGRVLGIGVTAPVYILSQTGEMIPEEPDQPNIPIKEILESRFPYKVFLANDVYGAIVGEQLYGYGKISENYLYIGLTDSMRMAVVNSGVILNTKSGAVSDLEHICVEPKGNLCECGNRGCLKTCTDIRKLFRDTQTTSIEKIMDMYLNGDTRVVDFVETFIDKFSIILSNLTKIFDVEYIIFGHEGCFVPQMIYNKVEVNILKYQGANSQKELSIVKSSFGNLACIRGAASIVFENFFNGSLELTV